MKLERLCELEFSNKWKNQGRKGVLGAQRDLLDLGYKELAQL